MNRTLRKWFSFIEEMAGKDVLSKDGPQPDAVLTSMNMEVKLVIVARRFSFWRRAIQIEGPPGTAIVWIKAGDTITYVAPFNLDRESYHKR